jgi:hypothetical protein
MTMFVGVHSTNTMSNSIHDIEIMKTFVVDAHLNEAPYIIQVTWFPPK